MRSTRFAAIVASILALVCLVPLPAAAKSRLLHAKFRRALATAPLDSVLFTMSQTSFDTLEYVATDPIDPTSVSQLDTATTAAVAAVSHVPIGSAAIVVEVTGAMQTMDSVYVGTQLSQGPTAQTDGSTGNPTGNQSDSYNWRWYNSILPAAGGVVVNSTGTQTFVYPIPCPAGGPNAYVWANDMRVIIQGDNTTAAKGFSTRVWLVTRDRP